MEKLWKSYGISFPGICTILQIINYLKLTVVDLGLLLLLLLVARASINSEHFQLQPVT